MGPAERVAHANGVEDGMRLARRYERVLTNIRDARAVDADRLRQIADEALKTGGDGRRKPKK